jgi:DNA (cytosine-5)-methyltransferase 1
MTHTINVLDLFSGIGGFSLGLERAGMTTVAFCEQDKFCQQVLAKHWPDVPCFDDVRTLDAETLADATGTGHKPDSRGMGRGSREAGRKDVPIAASVGTESGGGAGTDGDADEFAIDLICGGYPCQPFSHAGKRQGQEDDRHLWPEMHRLVATIRPRWVIAENVAGHISMGLDSVLSDLEGEGYTCWPIILPACSVGAPHRRDRVWIVANADDTERRALNTARQRDQGRVSGGFESGGEEGAVGHAQVFHSNGGGNYRKNEPEDKGKFRGTGGANDVADPNNTGRQQQRRPKPIGQEHAAAQRGSRWLPEPGVGRVDDGLSRGLHEAGLNWPPEPEDVPRVAIGVPDRVNRLKGLGNAVVPQIPEMIGRAIMAQESARTS